MLRRIALHYKEDTPVASNAFPKKIKPVIHASAGSYAEVWAKAMKYTFEAIE